MRPPPLPNSPLALRSRPVPPAVFCILMACGFSGDPPPSRDTAVHVVDLADRDPNDFTRIFGAAGKGYWGVPVASGWDLDGDGHQDSAFGAFTAPGEQLPSAGQVYVIWGNGSTGGSKDIASSEDFSLHIVGSEPHQHTGSELWMDDVTGDGLGDLLIARQNYKAGQQVPTDPHAAGALTIVPGGPELRALASSGEPLVLDDSNSSVPTFTIVGANAGDRLSIWMRTGDATGDGVADLLIGADMEDAEEPDAGAAYLVAGGAHLALSGTTHLDALEGSPLEGQVAHLLPPLNPSPSRFHFGATCQLGDLDGNGRAEMLVSATLNRAGATLDANGGTLASGSGGSPRGVVYIFWDDHLPVLPWPEDFEIRVGASGGTSSELRGQAGNEAFGEELLAGADWNGDGRADLFIGDLVSDFLGRPDSGSSHIVYNASRLKGLSVAVDDLADQEPPVRTSHFYGAGGDDLHGDTAASGDVNGDGIDDLIACSPHASPFGREHAGSVYVALGGPDGWPRTVDLRDASERESLVTAEIHGARGRRGDDEGDTLCYSAAAADFNADGRLDLALNEMVGNGSAPSSQDAGNLVLLDSAVLLGEP